jgi:hypothetical protein
MRVVSLTAGDDRIDHGRVRPADLGAVEHLGRYRDSSSLRTRSAAHDPLLGPLS